MTKYSDDEVDAVALAILNSDRADVGLVLFSSLEQAFSPDSYRRSARAALAARDALFEVVDERWEARDGEGYSYPYETRDVAAEERDELLAHGFENASLVHVVTKRRKR